MPPWSRRWYGPEGQWSWRERGGRRPPWWPDGEPWPPQDAEGWRQLRRRFMRRAGLFAIIALLIFAVLVAGIISLVTSFAGSSWLAAIGAFGLLLAFALVASWVLRGVRRTAEPIGDLVEASARVEAGELGVQVPERGMREVRALTRAFNTMSARLAVTEQERRRLLADVSHELRTPLTVIQGNVEAMLDGLYPADRSHLERIQTETQQLERLIEDLRTLSLAETGQLPLQREPTDVGALAREVVAGFEPEAQAGGVTLRVEAADDLPEPDLDGRRVHQVISNLIANALRHTPAGGRVTVSVDAVGVGIRLRVADTGVGMPAESVARAFDRFWRSGESAGAGLGLAIVRDLVVAHGGTAEIQSEVGRGTVVTCVFPG